MVSISVKSDIDKVVRTLNNLQRKQIPFAVSKALNDTAFQSQTSVRQDMPKYIDRPTPFTQRGVMVRRSTKANLRAEVYIPPERWKYMRFSVVGGSAARGNVPVAAKLNQYGSMGRGYLRRMLARKDTFSGSIGGRAGVWQRQKDGRLKLIAAYVASRDYGRRFPFEQLVRAQVVRRFPPNFDRAIARALATAR